MADRDQETDPVIVVCYLIFAIIIVCVKRVMMDDEGLYMGVGGGVYDKKTNEMNWQATAWYGD